MAPSVELRMNTNGNFQKLPDNDFTLFMVKKNWHDYHNYGLMITMKLYNLSISLWGKFVI